MHTAETTDSAVVRFLVACEYLEGQIFLAGRLDPAGGGDANAVSVEIHQNHHLRIISLKLTGILGLVVRIDGR